MPPISLDCLLVGLAVLVLAAINIGVARMVDRHLTDNLGAIRAALNDIVAEMRRGRSPAE